MAKEQDPMSTLMRMPAPPQAVDAEEVKTIFGRPRTRVVILGGGFAGVYTARHLIKLLGRKDRVDIELLSEENYFVFQPLLPEVAAGSISANHVVNPIREMLPGVRFRLCKIQMVDFANNRVLVTQGEGLVPVAVRYDHLVFCLGKVSNFAAMPGVAEHALGMKDLSDAFELRNHVIRCLEMADIEHDPLTRQSLLTFVVAGGGYSGVETIGELCELVHKSLRYYPNIRERDVLFKLVHAQSEILPEMTPKLRVAAKNILEKRQIELLLNEKVRSASPTRIYLQSERVLHARTFVCTMGNTTNPIVRQALSSGGFEDALYNGKKTGLFATDEGLQCKGRAGYWAVGDCAGVPSPAGKGLCPPNAQFATREAKVCAYNILATINSRPMRRFTFKELGGFGSLGQRSAVASVLGINLTGFLAWVMWRFLYLNMLPGFGRRLRVAIDWFFDLFFPRDLTQMNAARRPRLRLHHYEAGEMIINQGQIGRDLYVIRTGEVEVIKKGKGGQLEKIVSRLGPRSVFGEKDLLEGRERSASVRCATAVDVLVTSREDLDAMMSIFPQLQDQFTNTMVGAPPSLPE